LTFSYANDDWRVVVTQPLFDLVGAHAFAGDADQGRQ
jgi:hypothetical protein